jgi:general stress protein YciG
MTGNANVLTFEGLGRPFLKKRGVNLKMGHVRTPLAHPIIIGFRARICRGGSDVVQEDRSNQEFIMAGNARRGFALMDPGRQREIARKGGKAAHEKGTAHQFTADEAREAGRKGGQVVSQHREHMVEIGRSGGRARRRKRSETNPEVLPGDGRMMPNDPPDDRQMRPLEQARGQ